ncbi:MAG: hypothetical protein EBX57_11505, partial [Betaproteobacteria bacterium]|nr:hypothetical protein [Betaproteobacteria bacterium]
MLLVCFAWFTFEESFMLAQLSLASRQSRQKYPRPCFDCAMRPIGLLRMQQRSTPNVSALRKSEKTTLGKDQWFVITGFKVQH